MSLESAQREMLRQAKRLHHLGMIYGGAVAELARGKEVGLLPTGTPGLKATRDLICMTLLVRAEVNALTKILLDAKLVTQEKLTDEVANEYRLLTKDKADHFGCKVTDEGLSFGK